MVAEAAVVLMRPRDGVVPVDAAPQTYFSTAFIERAEDFRSGQLWLYGARVAIEIGLLVYVVRRPPARLKERFRRPVLAGAVTAAALAVTVTVLTLPVSAISRERAKDVGLVTQSWTGWLGDVAKGIALEIVIVGAGGALLVFFMRRFGRRWWAPAAALAVAFGVLVNYAGPIVLDPLFNKFKPLPAGELRSDVIEMAEEAGVKVGEVYEMDASRRTTAANAYVAGLGSTKRVVLYDTLLRDFTPEEVRLVVAHELGHVHHRDVPRGLLYLALVAPVGMFAVSRLAERWAPEGGPAAVPAVGLALALMVPAITIVYEMDASRRTTAANAYVAGLGSTKRVVLYDTLLRDFTPEEVRLVVAHELGHVHHRDVPRGLLYLALVAPVGMFAVSRLAERWAPEAGPAAVPAVGLALALMVPAITIVSNQLSRAVEARADVLDRATGQKLITSKDTVEVLEPALAGGRGARRPLLDRAHRRARPTDQLPEADHGPERVRPRTARLDELPARDAPDRHAADRPGPRAQGSGGSRGGASGRFLIPSLVRHLDQLSSIASISSRMKRGETLIRETTMPGTSSLSTSWSTRANVKVNS